MSTEEPKFLTGAQLHAQLKELGVSIEDSQLRSWRELGLLPPSLESGLARHPVESVQWIADTVLLFKIKNRSEYVGWRLWLKGYPVDDRYWRPMLKDAGSHTQRIARRITKFVAKTEEDTRRGDEFDASLINIVKTVRLPAPLSTTTRNLDPRTLANMFRIFVTAIAGADEPSDCDAENSERFGGLQVAMGATQADKDSLLGSQLIVSTVLPLVVSRLQNLRNAGLDAGAFRGNRLPILLSARDEFMQAFETAQNLHEAMAWVLGKRALGLRTARWIYESKQPTVQAHIIVGYMALFADDRPGFLSSSEIEEQWRLSQELLALSKKFQQAVKSDKKLAKIANPKRLRSAFRSEERMAQFIQEIQDVGSQKC